MRPAAAGSSNVESFTVCTIVNQRLLKAAPPQHDFRLLLQCGHQVARKPREQPLKSSQAKPPCYNSPLCVQLMLYPSVSQGFIRDKFKKLYADRANAYGPSLLGLRWHDAWDWGGVCVCVSTVQPESWSCCLQTLIVSLINSQVTSSLLAARAHTDLARFIGLSVLPLFTPGIPQRLVRVVWGAAGCPWLVRWANKLVKVY